MRDFTDTEKEQLLKKINELQEQRHKNLMGTLRLREMSKNERRRFYFAYIIRYSSLFTDHELRLYLRKSAKSV